MNANWYVLRSQQNKEIVLWRELTARGVECFYPQLHVKPVNPRSRKVLPYFPGYLFTRVDLEEKGVNLLHWMPFSNGLVSFGNIPASVPDNMVQAIRRHVDEINAVSGEQMLGLEHGDYVRIHGGAFDGYEAIFDIRLPGSKRVRVFLKLLQDRQIPVELPVAQIERIVQKRR